MVIARKDMLRLALASTAAMALAAVAGVVAPGKAGAAPVSSPSIAAASSSVAAAEDFALLYQNKETTTYSRTSETTYAVRASAKYAAEQDAVNIRPNLYGGQDYDKAPDKKGGDEKRDYKPERKDDYKVKPAAHKAKKNGIEWYDLKPVGASGGWYDGKHHAEKGDKVGFIPSDFQSHPKGTRYTVLMKWNDQKGNAVYKPNLSWNELNNYRYNVHRGGGAWMQVDAHLPDGDVKYYRSNLMVH